VGSSVWNAGKTLVFGNLSGLTNAGTHREPVFQACQPCDARGFMEGRFCGTIVRTTEAGLLGCHVFGTYRIGFDPSEVGVVGRLRGTLEGLVVCDCVSSK
jgi:hypothetical protein